MSMHPKALERMRQLVDEALAAAVVSPKHELAGQPWEAWTPLGDFLGKHFGHWLSAEFSSAYVYLGIGRTLDKHDCLKIPGPLLQTTNPEKRSEVAQAICDFWLSVPFDYEFFFELPMVQYSDTDAVLAPGVVLSKIQREPTTTTSQGLFGSLSGLGSTTSQASVACLKVTSRGLMEIGDESEGVVSTAIRKTKVVLELAKVEGVCRSKSPGENVPETVATKGPHDERGKVRLPHVLGTGLAGMRMIRGLNRADVSERFQRISRVIEGDDNWNRENRTPSAADTVDQHCARIAAAAEWLFDSEYTAESATTLVQTAIAFEALYGGGEKEPIVSTLSNRIAYALGTNPLDREALRDDFGRFYATRSAVVHSGTTSLTGEQRLRLFGARETLRRALRHEMQLAVADLRPPGRG